MRNTGQRLNVPVCSCQEMGRLHKAVLWVPEIPTEQDGLHSDSSESPQDDLELPEVNAY